MSEKFKLEIMSVLNNRLILLGSIFSVFIFLFVFNISFLNFKSGERGIASSPGASVQKSFIYRLSQLQKTDMTKFASKPGKLDKLRFEVLKGKYNIFNVDNKIQQLRLNIGEDGIKLDSPEDFLKEYRELLINDISRFSKLSDRTFKRDISSSMRIESYEVVENGKLKGRLDFEFGPDKSLQEVQMHWL